MTAITPAQLTAERLQQIADARKLAKLTLMSTIREIAIANASEEPKMINPQLAGTVAKLVADIKALQQLAHDYENKAGIFEDYIL